MSLPGLGLDGPEEQDNAIYGGESQSQTQTYELKNETEWRFEVAIGRSVTIKVLSGRPEIFGTELVVGHSYTFLTSKLSIFTWIGCMFDVTSDYGPLSSALTSEYVSEETPMHEYINVHFALEAMRDLATQTKIEGPRILLVGPENSGKSSVAKILTSYAIRQGRSPVVVNVDPSEGVLSLPGTFTATVFKTMLEVEEGWGTAPMSGPNGEIPVKLPLVYYHGSMSPEEKNGTVFKAQVRQVALAVSGRTAHDTEAKSSGVIVDVPGTLVGAAQTSNNYDMIAHIVSEFGISGILCLGSERLCSDLSKRFNGQQSSRSNAAVAAGSSPETISVVKLTKSGGVAERDNTFMQAYRLSQIRQYFYGSPKIGASISLQPRQQQVDFDSLTIWRRISSAISMAAVSKSVQEIDEFRPGGYAQDGDDDDDEYVPQLSSVPLPASQIFERITSPLSAMKNCVLAVMNCEPDPEAGTEQGVLRDSSVQGFLYVTDVDEGRGRISLLSPVAGRVPQKALIWGEGMERAVGLT